MNKTVKQGDDFAQYLFHQGTNFASYDYLGCHETKEKDQFIYTFRTWAPRAESISVVGDAFSWDNGIQMHRITEQGLWEACFKSNKSISDTMYKYKITSGSGTFLKADPYAFYSQTHTETASIVYDINGYSWNDEKWMDFRKSRTPKQGNFYPYPLNIYEAHLGSWKRKNGEYLSYHELADKLIPYVKEMGYTHIELMPISEHPFDGSWGYQICGYYAPTSRFGTPHDFMYFVDRFHTAGIGVILDWVPAHFPRDRHGLFEFDGYPQYEYQAHDRMEHKIWGTRFFDVGRTEVQSFLISNALFWFRKYHIDGLRVDAVASMLYLDYDKSHGEWTPNSEGNNKNLEGVAFFKKLNTVVFSEFPDVMMIAEESTSWEKITARVDHGGLGFNFKWNMGWVNDICEYVNTDPIYRQYCHNKLTFPMIYAYSENFILPISHDEVTHGKGSLISKMFGSYEDKFSSLKALFAFMMTFPGKKLSFMGNEFGQFDEWEYSKELDWFLLDFEKHRIMKKYSSDLNNFYLDCPELWEIDYSWNGFEWIEADMASDNVYSYRRKSISGSELIVVINFSPVRRDEHCLRLPSHGRYREIFNSDSEEYGGAGIRNEIVLLPDENRTALITLPPLSGIIIKKM